jgi:glycerol-3-phosphate O-acyltransferase/dihydroxyacetone phosphate acyltransferase
LRLTWSLTLLTISLPGLLLWLPVFVTTLYGVHNFKKRGGPVWDTWDEIAQCKLVYGLLSGVGVWVVCILMTLPVAGLTAVLVPSLMWITLRWLEDAISGFRAFTALLRLLFLLLLPAGQDALHDMRMLRADLYTHIMHLAVHNLGLPSDPERYFADEAGSGGRTGIWGRRQNYNKGRVRSSWESGARYFSVRRRRKRDWNETLRLYDKTDYPADDDFGAGASGDVQSI